MPPSVIVVHGGAGRVPPGGVRDAPGSRAALERAIAAAAGALDADAVAAAIAAVAVLEDDPRFNAGRGSVAAADGTIEMDAAVMCGQTRRAGAVAALTRARHPVLVAHAVMERSSHVLLAGAGADRFAQESGAELMDRDWFGRRDDPTPGTVGAVVRDAGGALAAATSTGGMRGQRPGRVGDSPLAGAGTYADDVCAVSLTGHGEAIVRATAAHELSALIRLGGLPLAEAAERVLADVAALGGDAGLIAVDRDGRVAAPFRSELMHRGWKLGDAPAETAILK